MRATDARALIAQYFRDLASWQRAKAASSGELPATGFGSTAEIFDAFAEFVLALPEQDARVDMLRRLTVLEDGCVISPGPQFSSALADLRHYTVAAFDGFLDYLVHVAIDDAVQSCRRPVPLLMDDRVAVRERVMF